MQRWFPPNCHYCGYRPSHVDDFERHVVKEHPGKIAYPGPAPEHLARALYIVDSNKEELKQEKSGYRRKALHSNRPGIRDENKK
ncbi:MAG: hypothetical protein WA941_18435 [Nitrososphaeraceae archaeon]